MDLTANIKSPLANNKFQFVRCEFVFVSHSLPKLDLLRNSSSGAQIVQRSTQTTGRKQAKTIKSSKLDISAMIPLSAS